MQMNDMLDKLAAYGVNLPEVMARFVKDKELYLECLASFMSDPAFEKLRAALLAHDYAAAFDQAHTLKGVAGNLGLTPLYSAICNIVESLRSGDYGDLEEQCQHILEEKRLLENILKGEVM